MNTAYFDHNSTATNFYNSVQAEQAHQAYRFLQQTPSLMPTSTYPTSNLRSGQSGVQSDGTNYDACKLYDSTSSQAFKAEAFKDCGLTKDQNGFKAPDHQMSANGWANSLRPSPSSTAMSSDMRSFDAVAACSRTVSDAWSSAGCCNSTSMSSAGVGAPPNAFYPWMAIAGTYLCQFGVRILPGKSTLTTLSTLITLITLTMAAQLGSGRGSNIEFNITIIIYNISLELLKQRKQR